MKKARYFFFIFLLLTVISKAQNWYNLPFTVLESECPQNLEPTGNEVFIQQVYDNTAGSYGALQLYNPTNQRINLSNYKYRKRTNYGTGNWTSNVPLVGYIEPRGIFLIALGVDNPETQIVCRGVNYDMFLAGTHGINENDQVQILKNNNVVDEVRINQTGTTIIRKLVAVSPKPVFNSIDWYFGSPNCVTVGTHPQFNVLRTERNITSPTYSLCNLPAEIRLILGGGSGQYELSDLNGNIFSTFSSPWLITPNFTTRGNKIYTIRDKNNPNCYKKIQFHVSDQETLTSPITEIQ